MTWVARLADAGLIEPGDDLRVDALAGGYWNGVYRLRAPGVDLVAKVFADGAASTLFPILPASEAQALETLAPLRVAPEPVAFLAIAPAILLYRFVPGERWTAGVGPVATLQRRYHAVSPEGFREVPTDPAGILAGGDALLRDLTADRYVRALRALRPEPVAVTPRPRCLIHTDAGAGNLIEGPDGLRLIDWQCPAAGDAAEDLFSFLSPAFQVLFEREPLTSGEHRSFLDAYDDEATAARLDVLWPALTYRMAAYACLRRATLADPVDLAARERYARAVDVSLADLEGR
jgi:hypothetical protein